MRVNIYVLIDPTTLKIRYIGRTVNSLSTRLIGHISKSKKESTHKALWINKLLKNGEIPIIKLFKVINGWKESHKYEQMLINKALMHGFNLTNSDDRGEGAINKIITEEQKVKISNSLKDKYKKGILKPTRTTSISTFDLNGNFIKKYSSCKECCLDIKIPQSSLENVLCKRVKRWKNYQITYGKNPGIYTIKSKDMSYLKKRVLVYNTLKRGLHRKSIPLDSYKEAAKYLNVSSPTIRRYIKSGKLLNNIFLITEI